MRSPNSIIKRLIASHKFWIGILHFLMHFWSPDKQLSVPSHPSGILYVSLSPPDHAVQRFYSIRGVDGLADIRWVAEERVQVFPLCTPAFADLGILSLPCFCERIQRHQRRLFDRGLIKILARWWGLCSPSRTRISGCYAPYGWCTAGCEPAGRRCLSHPGSPSDRPRRQSGCPEDRDF